MVNYITDEVKAFIGMESDWVESTDLVEQGQIRRHAQAIMDPDPIHWDAEFSKGTRYESVVAPPLFPLHALRPVPGVDQFEGVADDPNFDGSSRGPVKGLPQPPVALVRALNGGNNVELYQYAKPGERIKFKTKYTDIYQKEGRSGPMVFVISETVYKNDKDEILMKARYTRILR